MVVTRFAPSPTGYLHVGGARTAIFNWLWARHTGGKFVLRIEDTDIKRNTPTATQQLIDDLRWLGIDWDEGPQVGGPNGPYLQSQRKEQGIYDKYVNQLLEQGKAYYCFDTPEELEAMREKAVAQKKNLMYRRPDKFPDESEVKKAKAEGKSIVVRFAMPQEDIVVQDAVRGEVRFAAGEIGDFIIRKSDGFPTYNFACVVDDYLMKATHVIRGQEHLMNTPGQQALWQALGFGTLPKYAHMSVTVTDSGGKLSKRERPNKLREFIKPLATATPQVVDTIAANSAVNNPGLTLPALTSFQVMEFIDGKNVPDIPYIEKIADFVGVTLPEINVVDFFKSGYLPETMVNFLAFLGWNPGDDREIMSVGELINSFDLSRLTKANSLFDRGKLLAFNTEHIRRAGEEELLGHFKSYLQAAGSPLVSASDETLRRVIRACEGARTLADMDRKSQFLLLPDDQIEYDEKAVRKVLLKNEGLAVLATVHDKLAAMEEFTPENIETMLRNLAEKMQVGLGKVAQPLRVALCGTTISLPIFDSVEMLGRERTLARIDLTLGKFGGSSNVL
jgi:glutamyl/glutaminyl-tRNA synthetase